MIVCKEYIDLMPVAQTNADTKVICTKDVLLHVNIRIQDARGQCYNGCSTMTGTKNGVAAQILKQNEKCLLTHNYCHSQGGDYCIFLRNLHIFFVTVITFFCANNYYTSFLLIVCALR